DNHRFLGAPIPVAPLEQVGDGVTAGGHAVHGAVLVLVGFAQRFGDDADITLRDVRFRLLLTRQRGQRIAEEDDAVTLFQFHLLRGQVLGRYGTQGHGRQENRRQRDRESEPARREHGATPTHSGYFRKVA